MHNWNELDMEGMDLSESNFRRLTPEEEAFRKQAISEWGEMMEKKATRIKDKFVGKWKGWKITTGENTANKALVAKYYWRAYRGHNSKKGKKVDQVRLGHSLENAVEKLEEFEKRPEAEK